MKDHKLPRAMAPDYQGFDEVRIFTQPRYKMSGLSGDEWRISGVIQLFKKGQLRHEQGFSNVQNAAHALSYVMMHAHDDAKASYIGTEGICQQEGCSDTATVQYRVLKEFCRDHPHQHQTELTETVIREFCAKHSKRGDCAFDDADANYALISGIPGMPDEKDMRESRRIVVSVDNIEEIPGKLNEIRQAAAKRAEGASEHLG